MSSRLLLNNLYMFIRDKKIQFAKAGHVTAIAFHDCHSVSMLVAT